MKSLNLKKENQLEEAEPNIAHITNIIMNPKKYHPRKISTEDNPRIQSKFDAYDPLLHPIIPQTTKNGKRQSNLHNKFDMEQQNYNFDFQNRKKSQNFPGDTSLPLNKNYEIFGNC
jgi:hypothetical protein